MRLFDKVKSISNGIKLKSSKPSTEIKHDAEYHEVHNEDDGCVHGTFEVHDGKIVSASASPDAQESGLHEKAAKKAGLNTHNDKAHTQKDIKMDKMKKADKQTEAKAAEIKAKYKAANKPATSVSYDSDIPATPSNAKNFIAKMKEIKEKAKMGKAQGVPKGADPETHERCVHEVKDKGHSKGSAFAICNAAGAGMKKDSDLKKGYEKDEEGNLVYKKDTPSKDKPAVTISYGSKGPTNVAVEPGTKPSENWKKDWADKPKQAKAEFVTKLVNQRATGQKQETPIGGPKPKTAIETIKEKQAKKSNGDLPPPAEPPKPNVPAPTMSSGGNMQPNLMKDNMPHDAGSPEDKAHDIVEENQSLKDALSALSGPDKMRSMFVHLRELKDKKDLRSPENQAAGQGIGLSNKSQWMSKCAEIMKKTKWKPTLDF